MRLVETTCAISVVCLCLSLRAVRQEGPERKPPSLSPAAKAATQGIVDEMQGAWRLTSMDSPTLDKQSRTDVGYLLVAGSYFSFELHFGWTSADGTSTKRSFQSGTHHFEVDDRSRMTANSVIGSIIDDDGRVLFEQPGRKREYAVDCMGSHMKLKRDDGMTLEFERMIDTRAKRDFYGRLIKPKPPEEAGKGSKEAPPKKD